MDPMDLTFPADSAGNAGQGFLSCGGGLAIPAPLAAQSALNQSCDRAPAVVRDTPESFSRKSRPRIPDTAGLAIGKRNKNAAGPPAG
jgi:hypothetical protein